jgi:hypothetical protein
MSYHAFFSSKKRWSPVSTCVLVATGVTFAQGCLLSEPNLNYCANVNGDFFCAHRHGTEGPAFCLSASNACLSYIPDASKNDPSFDGCLETRPEEDTCYSPCGYGKSYDEENSCLDTAGGTETDGATTTSATTGMMVTTEALSADGTTSGMGTGGSTIGVDTGSSTSSATEVTASTTGTDTGSSTGSSTTDATAGPECNDNVDCVGNLGGPFCDPVHFVCVTCADLEEDQTCVNDDPTHPICQNGVCVACIDGQDDVCDTELHICDMTTNECVPCDAHENCEIGACNIFDGTCFPDSSYIFTLNDHGDDIGEEVFDVPAGGFGIIRLNPLPDGTAYDDPNPIVIDGSRTIAILSNLTPEKPWIRKDGNPMHVIQIIDDSTVYLQDLRIAGQGNQNTIPLECNSPSARLDVRGVSIAGNEAGVILTDCEARLENSFLQSLDNNIPAVVVGGNANVEIVYCTVVTDAGGGASNSVISCTGTSDLSIRNSLILSHQGGTDPEIAVACNSVALDYSVIESLPTGGIGNNTLEPPLPPVGLDYRPWFCGFDTGNLHLDTASIVIALMGGMPAVGLEHLEIAVPSSGDSSIDIDIDGAERGVSVMVGADVPDGPCI